MVFHMNKTRILYNSKPYVKFKRLFGAIVNGMQSIKTNNFEIDFK